MAMISTKPRQTVGQLIPPGLEPTTAAFVQGVAALGSPPIEELSVADARRVAASVQAGSVAKRPAAIEDRTIPGGPGGEISIRIVRPEGASGVLPVVMYFHGGGWVLDDKETYDRLVREIAHGAATAVVFVNYTRSPEARYPVAVEECYAATRWVATSGATLRLDGERLAVVGDSSGGNMATVVALLAKERGGPALACQVLFYPGVDAGFDTDSYRTFAEGPLVTRNAIKWFWSHYAPDIARRAEPTASPLRASLDQLQGLPPALIITAEFDVLRDEGEAYARRLSDAGVSVIAVRYLGTIHAFTVFNALAETPAVRAALAQASSVLRNAFAR
jgi:acetyl esterase